MFLIRKDLASVRFRRQIGQIKIKKMFCYNVVACSNHKSVRLQRNLNVKKWLPKLETEIPIHFSC